MKFRNNNSRGNMYKICLLTILYLNSVLVAFAYDFDRTIDGFRYKLDTNRHQATFLGIGDIKVTILGKIDLPQKHLKEIHPDKENIFIIDTNVFVKCPTIISKIGKYKVVIPTTVLEELDSLKLKPTVDQKALNDAVKNINKSFMNNFSKMEEGDSSLLPEGFNGKKADCLILSVALKYISEVKNPILLTSDNLLQSKALGLGVTTISLKDFLAERRF